MKRRAIMLSYREKTDILRENKEKETLKKVKYRDIPGAFDTDDKGWIVPPGDWSFELEFNHSKGVFGPMAWAENFYRMLDTHPPYIDPYCSMAGAYMDKLEWRSWGGWRP